MKNTGENMRKTGWISSFIPGLVSSPSAIPTSYARFSTDCEKWLSRLALHLGFIIDFSTYQQA
jgi:hypothetical protein